MARASSHGEGEGWSRCPACAEKRPPEQIIEKILFQHEVFGHDRFLMQFIVGSMEHGKVMRAIELYGTEVAPVVRAVGLGPAHVVGRWPNGDDAHDDRCREEAEYEFREPFPDNRAADGPVGDVLVLPEHHGNHGQDQAPDADPDVPPDHLHQGEGVDGRVAVIGGELGHHGLAAFGIG